MQIAVERNEARRRFLNQIAMEEYEDVFNDFDLDKEIGMKPGCGENLGYCGGNGNKGVCLQKISSERTQWVGSTLRLLLVPKRKSE